MIALVIDAHLIKAYFEEDEVGSVPSCTGSMETVINSLGQLSVGFIDTGRIIEEEWRKVTDPEWFVAWFSAALDAGELEIIDVVSQSEFIKKLRIKAGFPANTRDRWYVFTCLALVAQASPVVLLSEDLHFYEPSAKGCTSGRRLKLIEGKGGKVARLLRAEKIQVRSVAGHLQAVV